jgi:hypothetical protein
MRFATTAIAAAALIGSVAAAEIDVVVGMNSTGGAAPVFWPNNVTANVGDTIVFQFKAGNQCVFHALFVNMLLTWGSYSTVTQSSFKQPCQTLTNPNISTGFTNNVAANAAPPANLTVTVNSTAPLWFYCEQTNPIAHCAAKGMVFSVNAPANATAAQFQQNAMNMSSPSGTNSTNGTGTSTSTAPASTKSGAASTRVLNTAAVLAAVGMVAGLLL